MKTKQKKQISIENTRGQVVLYKNKLEVRLEQDTVWLTQKQMAELFDKDVRTINEHIKNVFKEGELLKEAVIRKFRITAFDGKRPISYLLSTCHMIVCYPSVLPLRTNYSELFLTSHVQRPSAAYVPRS